MSKLEPPKILPQILESWPREAQEYIMALQAFFQTQIADLQAQLAQNSQNSSRPPSADPPFKRPAKKTKEKSSKTRGGQVGHSRHLRELVPLEALDEIVEIYP